MTPTTFAKWIIVAVLFLFSASAVLSQDRAIQVRKRGDDANIKKSQRVALVIGNSNYKVAPLRNPANDAKAFAAVLRESGFEVDLRIDANLRRMDKSIRAFGKKLAKGGVGLFFYAGHGMQVKGVNYLIPIGTNIEEEDEVKYEAVDANRVLSKMSSAQNDLNLVFLDACRNNPFKRSFRSARQGLAPMDAPKGAMVSFATAPGNVAADGSGKHSPFTAHLLKQMREPGLEVGQVMRRVRMRVQQETGGKQTPWELSSMTGNFYFFPARKNIIVKAVPTVAVKAAPVAVQPQTPRVAAAPRSMDEEEEFWKTVKTSKHVEDLQSYLEVYPKGRFSMIARVKIRQLQRKPAPKVAVVTPPKATPLPVSYPRELSSSSEIRAKLTGKFRWTGRGNRSGTGELRGDGSAMIRTPRGKITGNWWVSGNQYCNKFPLRKKRKTRCYTLVETALNVFTATNTRSGNSGKIYRINSIPHTPQAKYPRRIKSRSEMRTKLLGKYRWKAPNGNTGTGENRENGTAFLNFRGGSWKGTWWITEGGICTNFSKRRTQTICHRMTEVARDKFEAYNKNNGKYAGERVKID